MITYFEEMKNVNFLTDISNINEVDFGLAFDDQLKWC